MLYEKSCGFVAYTEKKNVRLYLVIRALNGDYGFPKGHTEDGETEYETARRELKEETGAEVEIIEGFRCEAEYPLPRRNNVMKRSVYFLGRCKEDILTPQESEVSEARFVPFDEALELLTFEDTKRILKEANAYIDVITSAERCVK